MLDTDPVCNTSALFGAYDELDSNILPILKGSKGRLPVWMGSEEKDECI